MNSPFEINRFDVHFQPKEKVQVLHYSPDFWHWKEKALVDDTDKVSDGAGLRSINSIVMKDTERTGKISLKTHLNILHLNTPAPLTRTHSRTHTTLVCGWVGGCVCVCVCVCVCGWVGGWLWV